MQFITPQSRETIRLRKPSVIFHGLDRGLIRRDIILAEISHLVSFNGLDAACRTGNDGAAAQSLHNRRNHMYANCSSVAALSIWPTEPRIGSARAFALIDHRFRYPIANPDEIMLIRSGALVREHNVNRYSIRLAAIAQRCVPRENDDGSRNISQLRLGWSGSSDPFGLI